MSEASFVIDLDQSPVISHKSLSADEPAMAFERKSGSLPIQESCDEASHADIQNQIDTTFKKLKVVLDEEVMLRDTLQDLFLKQKLQAERELEMAKKRYESIAQGQENISAFLLNAATKATGSLTAFKATHEYSPSLGHNSLKIPVDGNHNHQVARPVEKPGTSIHDPEEQRRLAEEELLWRLVDEERLERKGLKAEQRAREEEGRRGVELIGVVEARREMQITRAEEMEQELIVKLTRLKAEQRAREVKDEELRLEESSLEIERAECLREAEELRRQRAEEEGELTIRLDELGRHCERLTLEVEMNNIESIQISEKIRHFQDRLNELRQNQLRQGGRVTVTPAASKNSKGKGNQAWITKR